MTESTRNPQPFLPILWSLRCNSRSGGLLVRRSNTQHVRTAICVPFSASHLCSPETAVLAEVWNYAFASACVSHPERIKASVHLLCTCWIFQRTLAWMNVEGVVEVLQPSLNHLRWEQRDRKWQNDRWLEMGQIYMITFRSKRYHSPSSW